MADSTLEYRDHAYAPWRESHVPFTDEDIATVNEKCGYEKYRRV